MPVESNRFDSPEVQFSLNALRAIPSLFSFSASTISLGQRRRHRSSPLALTFATTRLIVIDKYLITVLTLQFCFSQPSLNKFQGLFRFVIWDLEQVKPSKQCWGRQAITYHMPSPINCREGEPLRTPGFPCFLSFNCPISQRLLGKCRFSAPLQSKGPSLVPDPVTDPVIRAHVYQHPHVPLKECSDVVRCWMMYIQGGGKPCLDTGGAV